jgi:putative FmdB family regulatory protein
LQRDRADGSLDPHTHTSHTGTIIPIYEYSCQGCGETFEALVRGEQAPSCPACGSEKLERLFSLPSVRSSGTHAMAMRAARKRDERQGRERMHTQREYELSHED